MNAQRNILTTSLSLVFVLIIGCTTTTINESKASIIQNLEKPILSATTKAAEASPKSFPVQSTMNKFRFVAFGDYQGGASAGGTDGVLKNLRCSSGCPEPDFYINTGDIATLSLFGNKFPYGKLYPARGNNDSDFFWTTHLGQTKNYYSFTLFNTHFVVLYSGSSDFDTRNQFPAISANPNCNNPSNQTDWVYCDLDKAKTDAMIDNIIVVLHIPPLSNTTEAQVLTPIFMKHTKLRVVLSGHNHFYQRLLKDDINYLVIGGAGAKLYDLNPTPPAEVKKQAKQYHFAIFDVNGTKVTLSVIGYDDNLKSFAPIETTDLSCKHGETRIRKCNDFLPIYGKDTCASGRWLGQCQPIRPPNAIKDVR